MPISKTQRWLDLIAFLVKHRFPVGVEDLMRGVPAYAEDWATEDPTKQASVRRKFERDKDELRAAGIPLETVPRRVDGEDGLGYRLAEGELWLPYLRIVGMERPGADQVPYSLFGALEISAEDARLAMDALQRVAELPESPFGAEARSALAKLRVDLEPAHRPSPVVYADAAAGDGVRDTLRLLADALRERRRVAFRYHGIRRDEATDRDVAPYGLLYQGGHWYLVGDDATRSALRVFRLDRMDGAAAAEARFTPDPDFRLSDYARRYPWELGEDEPVEARVRFEFPLSLWAERNDLGEEVARETGGAVVRRFDVRQADAFLRWLQSYGGDARVTDPPDLRDAQAALARDTAALYG